MRLPRKVFASLASSACAIVGITTMSFPAQAHQSLGNLVEDFAYPNADHTLAEHKVKLIKGDGHILFAPDCTGPNIIEVLSSAELDERPLCFAVTAATGYLSLEIPQAYQIRRPATHTVRATTTILDDQQDRRTQTITVDKNIYSTLEVGGRPGTAVLIELRASSGGPVKPQTATGEHQYLAKVDIGVDETARSCSGVLVAPQWILTAASCFISKGTRLTDGPPAQPATVTVGRWDLTAATGRSEAVTQLVPHNDRDLVLAKLAHPVTGIAPISLGVSAPQLSDKVSVAGFGRTTHTWVPNTAHVNPFVIDRLEGTTFTVSGDAGICKGDAGAPAIGYGTNQPVLVGLAHTSWHGGCLGADPAARAGGVMTRTDGLTGWITSHTTPEPILPGTRYRIIHKASGFGIGIEAASTANDALGALWTCDTVPDGTPHNQYFTLTKLHDSIYTLNTTHTGTPAQCLTVNRKASEYTPHLRQHPYHAHPNQQWQVDILTNLGDGTLTVHLRPTSDTSTCLTTTGKQGDHITQRPCTPNNTSQIFTLQPHWYDGP